MCLDILEDSFIRLLSLVLYVFGIIYYVLNKFIKDFFTHLRL